jgi:hypothetical protein
MQVTHRAHFFDGHTFGHELLFHSHDLGCVCLADELPQTFFHQCWVGTRVQVLDDLLKNGNTMRPIVNQFAHGSLLELA